MGHAAFSPSTNYVDSVTPLTGQTVTFRQDSSDGTVYIQPAGAIAALTLNFPSDAVSRIGQICRVASTQNIASLTMTGGVVMDPISSLSANDFFEFHKLKANTWTRVI